MENENKPSGIQISWTLLVTIVAPIIVAYGTGVWFMADLTASVKRQGDTQLVFDKRLTDATASFDRRINSVEDKMSNNKDQIQATTSSINDRLIRMEAQLAYLVKTSTPSGR